MHKNQSKVQLDVGCYEHHVSVGLSNGEFLEAFTIAHEKSGFDQFFSHLGAHETHYQLPIAIAMEGFNVTAQKSTYFPNHF